MPDVTLTEFLLARIAEDEAKAEQSVQPDIRGAALLHFGSPDAPPVFVMHPTRVLAECEAKRVAVGWYEHDDDIVMGPTVRAMAAIYADHPDYDESWRP